MIIISLYLSVALPKENAYNKLFKELTININNHAKLLDKQNQEMGHRASMILVLIIVCSAIISFVIGEIVINNINDYMRKITFYLEKLSNGDFSALVSQRSLSDRSEFGDIARGIDKMKNNMKELISQSMQAIEQVAASSDELSASAEQSAQASNQVANSVTEVADSVERQLTLTHETNAITKQIADEMNNIAHQAQIVSAAAENTAQTAGEGGKAIQKTIDQMKVIEDKTNSTAGVIGQLEEKSKKIGQIVDVISGIEPPRRICLP